MAHWRTSGLEKASPSAHKVRERVNFDAFWGEERDYLVGYQKVNQLVAPHFYLQRKEIVEAWKSPVKSKEDLNYMVEELADQISNLVTIEDKVWLAHRVVGQKDVAHAPIHRSLLLEVVFVLIGNEKRQLKVFASLIAIQGVSAQS